MTELTDELTDAVVALAEALQRCAAELDRFVTALISEDTDDE